MGCFMLSDFLGRHVGHATHPQIGRRADGEEQALAVLGDRQVPRPVPLRRNVADDHFGRTRRFDGSAAIRIANHLVRRRHIDVLGVGRRLEDDAVRPVEIRGEDLGLRRRAARACAEHEHPAGPALRQEDVAVRRDAKRARLLESASEHLHREALPDFRQHALRRLDYLHGAGDRFFSVRARRRRRQVGRLDMAASAPGRRPSNPAERLRLYGPPRSARMRATRDRAAGHEPEVSETSMCACVPPCALHYRYTSPPSMSGAWPVM